ncbi:hypothetical protein E2562_027491 [Oryza meyeriana var. granulata]|uniref:Uncharacterized protein n=1 Tax=Oryza meyeriana var. granulata TaxID=110450 RepID=A0A6G1E2C4_9ORYZ|nr:hypothetical protein E2562_027491 [Oryza meyeriana var. granulata]
MRDPPRPRAPTRRRPPRRPRWDLTLHVGVTLGAARRDRPGNLETIKWLAPIQIGHTKIKHLIRNRKRAAATAARNQLGRRKKIICTYMGNCAVTQHAVSWADDGEWELPESESEEGTATRSGAHMTEVTIRITKRQLQELVDKRAAAAAGGGLGHHIYRKSRRSAAELLADIMNAGEVYHQHYRVAHWKPALQSIPEAAMES